MNNNTNQEYKYQVGSSLPPDAPSYVKRQADDDLYQALKEGKFCYVLNSRQMGKSSLCHKTIQRLQAEEMSCAFIDLTEIGSKNVTPVEWYKGLIKRLIKEFKLSKDINLKIWWEEQGNLSNEQRLSLLIEEVLLVKIKSEKIFIFIDEIDNILSLDFSLDDFFALIRFFYNNRAKNLEYNRLVFILSGVATPSDLIKDKTKTPFNIGTAIDLKGFNLKETKTLMKGLETKVASPELVMREILSWTGGQPFLTQKICQLIVDNCNDIELDQESIVIENIVQNYIIDHWESQQDTTVHLTTIKERLLKNEDNTGHLLGIYQQILQQERIKTDNSREQIELRLSGLVVKTDGHLQVYNQIYRHVFNENWVKSELDKLRRYSEAITAWVESDCLDESRLLRGEALLDALEWSQGKRLSPIDYRFFSASQELEKREITIALETEKEASYILAKANDEANQKIQKANKRILWGSIVLGLTILLIPITGLFFQTKIKEKTAELTQIQQRIDESEISIKIRESIVLINGQKEGNGVIVGYKDNTYYVLTVRSLVTDNESFEIKTIDNLSYKPEEVKEIPNSDLVILHFQSSKIYQIAKISQSPKTSIGETIYYAGYANSELLLPKERIYYTTNAEILKSSIDSDYESFIDSNYFVSNKSILPGMIGSPILNNQGEIIGINQDKTNYIINSIVSSGGIFLRPNKKLKDNEIGEITNLENIKTLIPDQYLSHQNTKPGLRFICAKDNDGVFMTGVQSSDSLLIVIRWESNDSWNPREKCIEVSNKWQELSDHNKLNYFSAGYVNKIPVICATVMRGDTCNSDNILITLKQSDNPDNILQQLNDINGGKNNIPIIL